MFTKQICVYFKCKLIVFSLNIVPAEEFIYTEWLWVIVIVLFKICVFRMDFSVWESAWSIIIKITVMATLFEYKYQS